MRFEDFYNQLNEARKEIKLTGKSIDFKDSPIESIPKDIKPGTKITFVGTKSNQEDTIQVFYISKFNNPGKVLSLTTNKKGEGVTHFLKADRIRKSGGGGSRPNQFTVGNFTDIRIN